MDEREFKRICISSKSTLGTQYVEDAAQPSNLFASMHPNPVRIRNEVTISIELERQGAVGVFLCDILGRRSPWRLYDGLSPGSHRIVVPTEGYPPGMYHVVVQSGEETVARRLVIMR